MGKPFDAERLWVWEPLTGSLVIAIEIMQVLVGIQVEDFVFKFFLSASPRMFQEHINSMSWEMLPKSL